MKNLCGAHLQLLFKRLKEEKTNKQLLNRKTTINEKILFNFPKNSLQNMKKKSNRSNIKFQQILNVEIKYRDHPISIKIIDSIKKYVEANVEMPQMTLNLKVASLC